MSPLVPPDHLIACIGNRMGPHCAEVMARVADYLPHLSIRFVDVEWLTPAELTEAALCWVTDAQTPPMKVQEALRTGLPLLAPAGIDGLTSVLQQRAFSYHTPGQAADWMINLLERCSELKAGDRSRHNLSDRRATR